MMTTRTLVLPAVLLGAGCYAATPQGRAGEVGYACSMNMLGGGIGIR